MNPFGCYKRSHRTVSGKGSALVTDCLLLTSERGRKKICHEIGTTLEIIKPDSSAQQVYMCWQLGGYSANIGEHCQNSATFFAVRENADGVSTAGECLGSGKKHVKVVTEVVVLRRPTATTVFRQMRRSQIWKIFQNAVSTLIHGLFSSVDLCKSI